MRSREIVPSRLLRPYVRLYWIFELDEAVEFGPAERILPDGLVELVLHYGTPFALRRGSGPFERQPRAALVSQTRGFVEIRPEGPSGLISVRFQPWGAWHFLPLPVAEVADLQVPASEIWEGEIEALTECLAGAGGDAERIALVEAFLLRRLERHRRTEVETMVRAAWAGGAALRVRNLAADLGVGERTLQRLFRDALGTSPKEFLQLARFLRACRLLREASAPLADIALDCGYYDQSHFTAEFRRFSGFTPGRFAAAGSVSFLDVG